MAGILRPHEENCKIMKENLKRPVHMLPRYAGGRVFIRSQLGALYAQAYRTPGILELAEALVMPSRRGQMSYPWLIEIPSAFDGKPYGDLVKACLANGLKLSVDMHGGLTPILPVGLFRDEDSGLGIRYVFSNPSPEITVVQSDKMYVFASEDWGHAYTSRGKDLESFPWEEWGEAIKANQESGVFLAPLSLNPGLEATPADIVSEGPGGIDHSVSDEIINEIFNRYDSDLSGTLNTIDEVRMLTTNACFKLGIRANPPAIEAEVKSVWDEIKDMDLPQYRSWFHTIHGRLLQKSA